MTQEQSPLQELLPVEKLGSSGSGSDASEQIIKQVNEALAKRPINDVTASERTSIAIGAIGDFPSVEIAENKIPLLALGDALAECKEGSSEKFNKFKDVPLSRTENLILNGLTATIGTADLTGLQNMLSTLAEHPNSIDRVLKAAREKMAITNPNMHVGWERGTDDQGNDFVRLKMDRNGSKSGPFTHLTVGSDGTTSASHTPFMQYDRPPQTLTGEQALKILTKPSPSEHLQKLQIKPNYEPYNVPKRGRT